MVQMRAQKIILNSSDLGIKESVVSTRMLQDLREDLTSVDFVERLAAYVSTQSPARFEPRSFKNSVLNGVV